MMISILKLINNFIAKNITLAGFINLIISVLLIIALLINYKS